MDFFGFQVESIRFFLFPICLNIDLKSQGVSFGHHFAFI